MPVNSTPAKVAYIVSRFPKISETFILREMIALRDRGWDIVLFPLILENRSVIHAEAKPWLESLHYFPWISWNVFIINLQAFMRKPVLYVMLWLRVVLGNIRSLNFLTRAILIFPKTICMAEDMRKNNVQHVHAHFSTHPGLAAWIIHRWTGISYSVTTHAHDLYVDRTMLEPKLKEASLIITISEFNRNYLSRYLGEQIRNNVEIVHCGIEPSLYLTPSSKSPADCFQIRSIGSLRAYKGMSNLIKACDILRERGIPFDCQIVGEGEEQAKLETLISRLALQKEVILLGARTQKEVAEILKGADCYVQPSVITRNGEMEGIPVAIMEALCCALPVVASDISGIPELVRHGETGYLVPPDDPLLLADAIEHVYRNSQEAECLGKAGRELVLREFTLDGNSSRMVDLFSRLIQKR